MTAEGRIPVVIEVADGMVQAIFTNDARIQAIVVDHDLEGLLEGEADRLLVNGEELEVMVTWFVPQPLNGLAEAAINYITRVDGSGGIDP